MSPRAHEQQTTLNLRLKHTKALTIVFQACITCSRSLLLSLFVLLYAATLLSVLVPIDAHLFVLTQQIVNWPLYYAHASKLPLSSSLESPACRGEVHRKNHIEWLPQCLQCFYEAAAAWRRYKPAKHLGGVRRIGRAPIVYHYLSFCRPLGQAFC